MSVAKPQAVVMSIPDGSGGTDSVQFSACITETHTLTNTLTDHPVEQGFNITDHSRPEPRRVTVEIMQAAIESSTNLAIVSAQDLWNRLVALQSAPQLIAIQTVRSLYTSMAIETVTSPLDSTNAQSLKASIGFKQIRVVQNRLTTIVVAKRRKAQPVNAAGGVGTPEATAEQKKTALKFALDYARSK